MLDFLVVLSVFGVVGMSVALIVAAVRRTQKRMFAIGLVFFLVLYLVSVAVYPVEEMYEVQPPQVESN